MSRFLRPNDLTSSGKRNDVLSYPIMIYCTYNSDEEVEIPYACRRPVLDMVVNPSFHRGAKFVFPYFKSYRRVHFTGAEPVFNNMIGSTGNRLVQGVVNGTDVYYGNSGIILNAAYTPLVFLTKVFKPVLNPTGWEYVRTNVYINPIVFTEESKMHNLIKKKIVPFFLQREDCKVFFDDSHKFVVKSQEPEVSDSSYDDSINTFLQENIRDVLEQIVYDSNGLL